MTHLDEATVLTLRDGGPLDSNVSAHLDDCARCSRALSSAQARAEVIAQTLTALDGAIEATAAKAGVRARVRATGQRPPRTWGGRHLGRAAALLLVTAGAAAALPGSPLRSWLGLRTVEPEVVVPAAIAADASAAQAATADASPSGISIVVADGPVDVVVRGAAPGSEVSLTWTDRPTATVSAAPGSRYTYAAGRVEVDASRGTVLVELSQAATRISLEVDGDVYLRGRPDAVEIVGPVVERTGASIRFRVPER